MFNKTLDLATTMLRGLLWLVLLAALVLSLGWGYGDTAQAQPPLGGSGITAVSVGYDHTCVLKFGGVWCWGANDSGQLGNGSNTDSSVPVEVSGLGSGITAVSAGRGYTCALTTGGGAWCWGDNDDGQLGNGSNTDSNVPVKVSGLDSGISAISAGNLHTCALTTGGGVRCWGYNHNGGLGNGSNTDSNVPVEVSRLGSGVSAISTGIDHTCALATGGGVWCWGGNFYGQLGIGSNGSNTGRNVPVKVSRLGSGVSAVSAGRLHTCALTTRDRVQCWGLNYIGQLGNGSNTGRNVPVEVSNVPGLSSKRIAIDAGWDYTCALTTGGGVQCWGANDSGQLGNGSNTDSNVPVEVSRLGSGVSAVSGWNRHTCALTTGGGVQCWGANNRGQLGNGSNTNSNVPVPVR